METAREICAAGDDFDARRERRLLHIYKVIARVESAEKVCTIRIGRLRGEQHVTGVDRVVIVQICIKLHGRAREQRLVGVHDSILVGIEPHGVADASRGRRRRRRTESEIGEHVLLARRKPGDGVRAGGRRQIAGGRGRVVVADHVIPGGETGE